MSRYSYHILRVGMGVMFLWIAVFIFRAPEAFGGYMQPWALRLLPVSVERALLATAALDAAIGLLLLWGRFARFTALVGSLHLLIILVVSGITDVTVRDIGLLAGTLALFFADAPAMGRAIGKRGAA